MILLRRRAFVLAAPALLLPRAALALSATPRGTEGPFYPPADRITEDDNDLVRVETAVREAGGEILRLAGRVLDVNARPVADARVEIWQCDANGIYLHPGSDRGGARDTGFQGFGHAVTDAAGRFAFRTIVPVPYPGRTPHIHVKVLTGGREALTTQLYRAGYPQNHTDFLYRRLAAEERRLVSMEFRDVAGAERRTYETAIDLVLG